MPEPKERDVALTTVTGLDGFVSASPTSPSGEVIRAVLSYLSVHPETLTESCIVASSAVAQQLRSGGVDCVILEGELAIAPKSWLQHRVVVVEGTDEWVVIDIAARQVPRLKDFELLVMIMSPSADALQMALQSRYDWWIAANHGAKGKAER